MKTNKILSVGLGMILVASTASCGLLSRPVTTREQAAGIGGLTGGASGAIIGSLTGGAVAGGLFGIPLGLAAGYFIGDQIEQRERYREAYYEDRSRSQRYGGSEFEGSSRGSERLSRSELGASERRDQRLGSAGIKESDIEKETLAKSESRETAGGSMFSKGDVIGDITFDRDKAELKGTASRDLEPVVMFLKENPKRRIIIEGYTDNTGSESYNRKLSEKRANAVRDFLVKESGVNRRRITVRGMGEADPIASDDSEDGRRQNRRAEVIVAE